jgi:hypothetical protein
VFSAGGTLALQQRRYFGEILVDYLTQTAVSQGGGRVVHWDDITATDLFVLAVDPADAITGEPASH